MDLRCREAVVAPAKRQLSTIALFILIIADCDAEITLKSRCMNDACVPVANVTLGISSAESAQRQLLCLGC